MMNMEHRLVQSQTQRLMLTQKMQQAIQILQLSSIELDQYVQQELETNPVLEQVQKEPEQDAEQPQEPRTSDDADTSDNESFDLDAYANQLTDVHREGTDFSRNPEADSRRRFYEDSITREESFTSKLLTQLNLATDDEQIHAIGERIIGDIDGKGYFTGSIEEIAGSLGVAPEKAERVLYQIQRFEPTGVGARDVVECLLLQINVEYPDEEELKVLVAEHLDALERRQIPKIAKAMRVTPERVEQLKTMLATLDPWPGHEFSLEPAQYVTPDVIVERTEDDEYIVYLTNDTVPELRLSRQYGKMLKQGKTDREAKQYIRGKVESARWLIRNIEQRQSTILRIATAIVDVQEAFFDKGIEQIRPLTLQEIADKVGVHEATVSRTTRGKYMQTPQGLFEMKFFFSPGLRKDSGENQSAKSVQSMIKTLIDEEDKNKPLSDQKVSNILKEQGINIARRTVTKYRENLGILTTSLRKQYQ